MAALGLGMKEDIAAPSSDVLHSPEGNFPKKNLDRIADGVDPQKICVSGDSQGDAGGGHNKIAVMEEPLLFGSLIGGGKKFVGVGLFFDKNGDHTPGEAQLPHRRHIR